jgi:hypothetical protein
VKPESSEQLIMIVEKLSKSGLRNSEIYMKDLDELE